MHDVSNENGVRTISFAVFRDIIIKSTFFKREKAHKGTWTPFGKHYSNQIDDVLINRRCYANILDVMTRRGAKSVSAYHLVVVKVKARLSANKSKHASEAGLDKAFDLRKFENESNMLNEVANRFSVLDN